jgi:hypothetical protein
MAGVALGIALEVEAGVEAEVEVEVDGAAVALEEGAVDEAVSLGDGDGAAELAARRFAGIDAAVRSAPTNKSAIARALAADRFASRPARSAAASAFIL